VDARGAGLTPCPGAQRATHALRRDGRLDVPRGRVHARDACATHEREADRRDQLTGRQQRRRADGKRRAYALGREPREDFRGEQGEDAVERREKAL